MGKVVVGKGEGVYCNLVGLSLIESFSMLVSL